MAMVKENGMGWKGKAAETENVWDTGPGKQNTLQTHFSMPIPQGHK